MLRRDGSIRLRNKRGLYASLHPRPRIAEPKLREHMDCRVRRSAIMYGDLYQDVVRSGFEVLHEYIPITVAFEHASIDQLVLVILETTLCIPLNQEGVRIFTLRVLVQHPEIRM